MAGSSASGADTPPSGSGLPPLPLEAWEATRVTLHLFLQIVGKVRLASTPRRNHWWNVPLYVSPRGLTTQRMHLDGIDFEVQFDFLSHRLRVEASTGGAADLALEDGLSVRAFYGGLMASLHDLGLHPTIRPVPFGMPYSDIPFQEDDVHSSYDTEAVTRFWRVLRWIDEVFAEFAGPFRGKQSPIHLFWHSFDLVVARFSGRLAPPIPEADAVTREAYAEELVSFGFWPGDPEVREPTFYSYTAPEPADIATHRLRPREARWVATPGGSIAHLAYETVRGARDPRAAVLDFLESTFRAGATAGHWPSPVTTGASRG